MVVLYEKNSLGNQPISDGENKTTSRQKVVRSVALIKKARRHHPFALKKVSPPGCLCFSYEAYCCTAPGPERRAVACTWTHERERPLGLGGRQHDGAAQHVIRRDQAVAVDLLFSWLLLLLLCKLLGRAAPRMVYGAARIPPWRRAPPLAHVYVVAVRAVGLESWPRLLLSTCLGSDSKRVVVYLSAPAHSYSYDTCHCQPLPDHMDICFPVCPWSRFLLVFLNCPSRNRLSWSPKK